MRAVTTTRTDADWNAVYQRELPRIYNYFRYRFGDNAVAEDLTAATFEKAWRAREKYRVGDCGDAQELHHRGRQGL